MTAAKHRVLLAGFGPFEGRAVNGSQTIVEAVADADLPGTRLHRAILDVRWGAVEEMLVPQIQAVRPQLILGIGEGRPGRVAIETKAHNCRSRPDVDGNLPPVALVDTAGSASKSATLVADPGWFEDEHAVVLSDDAGAFLCNNLLYVIADRPATVAGFVHLPPQGDTSSEAYVARFKPLVLEILRRNLPAPAESVAPERRQMER